MVKKLNTQSCDNVASALTDEELIFLFQSRDIDPYSALIQRYKLMFEKIISSYFIVGYDKEDMRQECYLLAYKAFVTYEQETQVPLRAYLDRYIRQGIVNIIRKSQAQKRKIDRVAESLESYKNSDGVSFWESYFPNEHPLADEHLIVKENYSVFLQDLSRFEKDVFNLYMEGFGKEEIAQNLGVKLKKVANAMARCRQKLRKATNF